MATIPLPALALHTPEQPDIGASLGRMMQLKGMMQQQQSQGIAIQQQQQQLADQKAMTAAFKDWDGKDPQELIKGVIGKGGSAQAVVGLQSHILQQKKMYSEMAKDDAETGAKNIETAKNRADAVAGAVNGLKSLPDDQLASAIPQKVQELVQSGILTPQEGQKAASIGQLQDPQKMRDALDSTAKMRTFQSQQLTAAKDQADLAAKKAQLPGQIADSQKAQKVNAGTSPTGITADQQRNLDFEAAKLRETQRHNLATEGQLTPEAITVAASQFAATGKLPDVGRNNAARAQIINEAARVNPTVDLASNSAAYKANVESLKGLQKNFDAVTAFENTANKNLDLFLQQAKKVVDFGSPWVNKPLRSLDKNMLGSADQVAYETARQVAVNEIAKVTGSPGLSGQLTDSARHEVSNFNPDNATLAQTYKVATVLRRDMANRHESYAQQIQAIQNRIKQNPGDDNGGGTVRIKASDGSMHDIPAGNLDKAKQIDPKLQVVQ